MSEPCRCLESATDLSGLVNIEPTTIAVGGNATVRQGILRTNGIRVAVKAGRFLNDKQSYEVCFPSMTICTQEVDLISAPIARYVSLLHLNMKISLNYSVISFKNLR